jgi:pimeloyl-ACP methyl ester carboxylesterase
MTTFVLVHGAWSGSHSFRKVRPLIRAAGHDVFTPCLTGLGARVHLSSPQVDLSTHVADVANLVLYEDLRDIVLLGYSYGGMVVTGALAHIADHVSHLVYLDAFLPGDGQSLDDLVGLRRPGGVIGVGPEWLVAPPERTIEDADEAAWWAARRSAHPIACFTDPVRLPQRLEEYPFTRTYIKATGEPRPAGNGAFWVAGDHAKESPAWRYREIATNHMIPINRPEEMTELLLELA